MSNKYDRMEEYVFSIFNVFQLVNRKSQQQNDKKFKMIALSILNYARYMAKEFNIELKEIKEPESINLIPIFEYIAVNNIELYDFSNININDVDVSKKEDIERYVLSHVYYITQN